MEDLRAKPFQSLNVLQRETFDIIMRESFNVFFSLRKSHNLPVMLSWRKLGG